MDLGVFRRKRATFWAWILLPALLVVVSYCALHVYCDYAENQIDRREAVLGILGDVEHRLNVAKDVVCGFAMLGDAQTPVAADVSSRISELAARHAFTLNSLQVNQSDDKKSDSRSLEIELKGVGDMLALMQFLNELQSPQHLTVVEGASMRLQRQQSEDAPRYEVELTVRCCRDALQGGGNV